MEAKSTSLVITAGMRAQASQLSSVVTGCVIWLRTVRMYPARVSGWVRTPEKSTWVSLPMLTARMMSLNAGLLASATACAIDASLSA